MVLAISSLSVGCRNIVVLLLFDSLKNAHVSILCFFRSFSYRGKVIIKGVRNISQGLVIVSPLSKDSTVGTLDATVFRVMHFFYKKNFIRTRAMV